MTGLRILITGGSGTLGTALVRYALARGAANVVVLSRGEHRQALLRQAVPDPRLECWIGDVRDRDRMRWAMRAKPDLVIHAAAMKRVEVCEANPAEAVKTNIDGTRHVVEEAMWADVPRILVISSDKATSPETCYGKTKAAAEEIALGQNAMRGKGRTRVSVVRYGNILGSQGSVLDTFMAARHSRADLQITDLSATRFWWSIEDAVAFIDRVQQRMHGAEIWVPRLVSSKVLDLAQAIAPASAIRVTGMRGPEKIHEVMISPTEARVTWALLDCYVLLPKEGQWWSPAPPEGAVKVAADFRYDSADLPLPVALSFESPEEGHSCASGLSV